MKVQSKLYIIVLILLISLSFFFNFNKFTGNIVNSPEEAYEKCGEIIYSSENNQKINGVAVVQYNNKEVIIRIVFDLSNNPFINPDELFIFDEIKERYELNLKDGRSAYIAITKKHEDCGWSIEKIKSRSQSSQGGISCSDLSLDECIENPNICEIITENVRTSTDGCAGIISKNVQRCVERINIQNCRLQDIDLNNIIYFQSNAHLPILIEIEPGPSNPNTYLIGNNYREPLITTKSSSSQHCSFYSFNYHKPRIEFTYDAPLVSQLSYYDPNANIWHCKYATLDLLSLPPGVIGCDELREPVRPIAKRVIQCPLTYTCTLISNPVNEIFGYGIEKDDCSNKQIWFVNNARPISNSDLNVIANNFIRECSQNYQDLCGNGKIDLGEECDDGNKNDGDGCNKECKRENPICNGIIPPATQPSQIKGTSNIAVNVEIDTHDIFFRYYKFEGKITNSIEIDNLIDGKLPKKIKYVSGDEGNSAIIDSIYEKDLLEKTKKSPHLFNLLKDVKGEGILGTGFIIENEEDYLTIKKIYSLDPSIKEFMDNNKNVHQSNWMAFYTTLDISYSEGSGAVIIIKQEISNDGQIRFSKQTMTNLSDEEARTLIFEILSIAESLDKSQKDPSNGQWTAWLPIADGNDLYDKFRRNELREGIKIKQKEDWNKRYKATYDNNLSNILRYFNECTKNLFGNRTSGIYDSIFYLYLTGGLI